MIDNLNDLRKCKPLPLQNDFGFTFEAKTAWTNFGGLTLNLAFDKFCTSPEIFEENFMFMGDAAFRYYFPVLDKYLKTVKYIDDYDACEAESIGVNLLIRCEDENINNIIPLFTQILDLAEFVLSNLSNYSSDRCDLSGIEQTWKALISTIQEKN